MTVDVSGHKRLAVSMLVSMAFALFYLWAATLVDGSFGRIVALLVCGYSLIGAWQAYRLDDTGGPLITLSGAAIVVHGMLLPRRVVPWADVRDVRFRRWRIAHVVPIASFLMIRLRDRSALPPLLRWLPLGWLGVMLVPARFAEGGAAALAHVAVQARTAIEVDLQARALDRVSGRTRATDPEPSPVPVPAAPAPVVAREAAAPRPVLPGDRLPEEIAAAKVPMLNGKPLVSEPRRGFGRKVA